MRRAIVVLGMAACVLWGAVGYSVLVPVPQARVIVVDKAQRAAELILDNELVCRGLTDDECIVVVGERLMELGR